MSTARLMKSELLELTPEEELVEFWRQNPVVACKDIFGINLVWLQRIALREMWLKDFVMIVMSRGLSKTYINIVFACLRAIL